MKRSTEAAWERAMKIQEVMLRAMAKRITWWQAAEIIGISCRQMRRWLRRYEEHGYEGLRDRRRGNGSNLGEGNETGEPDQDVGGNVSLYRSSDGTHCFAVQRELID